MTTASFGSPLLFVTDASETGVIVFEPLDTTKEKEPTEDPVTAGESLGVYGLILLLGFGSLAVFITLGNRPYGMQTATLISYSGVIFIWTFFRTKGVNTKHSLSAPYVLEQLPRLLMIHFAYLLALFVLETQALDIRSSMPRWWLVAQGRKGMPPFDFALMLILMVIAVSQIFISRRILGRAKKAFLADSAQAIP
jgi:ABC-type xylose transport system permease subunit